MIYHHPLPLDSNATSASGIRPLRMLNAFRALGCEVDLITGYSIEREKLVSEITKKIATGVKYDFVYSESSTMPTLLTDRHHFPLHPTVDFGFFKFCKKNNIPIGLFYRDIYWLFPEYYRSVSFFKAHFAKLFYKYDLLKYNKFVDKIYLPSIKMAKYIPTIKQEKFDELPPGYEEHPTVKNPNSISGLNLLYIGGIGNYYQLHEIFYALTDLSSISFTLCTREGEWDAVKKDYPHPLPSNIKIVHKNGAELTELYEKADIAMLFVKPIEYREFTSHFKLYEAIGQHKPVIASLGTLAGQFVRDQGIGWAIPYQSDQLTLLLKQLLNAPDLIKEKTDCVQKIASNHTWKFRAQKVIQDLWRKI